MTVIGIASIDGGQTDKIIKSIFSRHGRKVFIADSRKLSPELIEELENAGVGYVVIKIKKGKTIPVYLDVLILETAEAIDYELVKCISSQTRLIYNTDNKNMPFFVHPNAISYGMAYDADATASSVDDKEDGTAIVYCLQKTLKSLEDRVFCECEIPVKISESGAEIGNIIAAVTCGLLCDVPINILLNM